MSNPLPNIRIMGFWERVFLIIEMKKETILLKLLNYVRAKKSYTLASCIIPKEILNYNNPSGPTLKLKQLLATDKVSSNERDFIKDLGELISLKKEITGRYYRQFPFPIDNRSLWRDRCCPKFGVTDRRKINTSFFKLDLYFPELRCAVEVDSDLHDAAYDKARDAYLMNTGNARIKTIRCPWYNKYEKDLTGTWKFVGHNVEGLKEVYQKLKAYQSNITISDSPKLDFSLSGVEALRHTYQREFDALDWILEGDRESVVVGQDLVNRFGLGRDQIKAVKKFALDIFEVDLINIR